MGLGFRGSGCPEHCSLRSSLKVTEQNLQRALPLIPRFWGSRVGECKRSRWLLKIQQLLYLPKGATGRDSALRHCLPNYLMSDHLAACLKCRTWRAGLAAHSGNSNNCKVEPEGQKFMVILSYLVHKGRPGLPETLLS